MRIIRQAAVATFVLATMGSPLQAQASTAASTLKIGYINSQVLLQGAPGRAEAEAQFEKEMSTYRTQVQRMGDSLNTLVADFRKLEASLSPTAKETRMKTISQKEEEYQTRTRQLEQAAQQRQMELIRPITEQVQVAIGQVRTEEGYHLIFDVGTQAGVLVAADSSLDVTSKVMARLQVLAKAGPTTRPGTGPAIRPATVGPALGQPAGVSRPKLPPKQ